MKKMVEEEKAEMDIYPLFNNVFFREVKNPFKKEKTNGGIFLPQGTSFSDGEGSGDIKEMDQFIKIGQITKVSKDTKYVQEGDFVFYDKRTVRPVPYGEIGLWQINEQNIMGYVR
jgi:co-chaperonin GroES (HSP10)